jgi:hypothetical protein
VAVGIDLANLIARKAAVELHHPGGLDHFAGAQGNYIEDEHLLRIGAGDTASLDAIAAALVDDGVSADDLVLVGDGPETTPPWLEEGDVDGHRAVWLAGTEPGRVVPVDAGWLERCTADVLAELRPTLEANGVTVRVGPGPGEHTAERWEVGRGDALVDLDVLHNDGDVMAAWVLRRPARRLTCLADIELGVTLAALVHSLDVQHRAT